MNVLTIRYNIEGTESLKLINTISIVNWSDDFQRVRLPECAVNVLVCGGVKTWVADSVFVCWCRWVVVVCVGVGGGGVGGWWLCVLVVWVVVAWMWLCVVVWVVL